jgi:GH25 family lysozyme M1 (1,4-beta-N-acetylmuramidase)
MSYLHGIDLSHYQLSSWLPWAEIGKTSQFVIVKFSDGTNTDKAAAQHIKIARGLGLKVGGYHFFREGVSVADQLDVFGEQADLCGIKPGDILPSLDLEPPKAGTRLTASVSALAEQWMEDAAGIWGDAQIYLSQKDWSDIGQPSWPLCYSLWVEQYPERQIPNPATPGHRQWRIWQYNVGPYNPGSFKYLPGDPHALDHNFALDPLPLIVEPGQVAAEPEKIDLIPLTMTEEDWAKANAERDQLVRGG